MNQSHVCKGWKHWSKSPASVSLDQNLYRSFFDTPTFDAALLKAIQIHAIITPELKTKKGGRT